MAEEAPEGKTRRREETEARLGEAKVSSGEGGRGGQKQREIEEVMRRAEEGEAVGGPAGSRRNGGSRPLERTEGRTFGGRATAVGRATNVPRSRRRRKGEGSGTGRVRGRRSAGRGKQKKDRK